MQRCLLASHTFPISQYKSDNNQRYDRIHALPIPRDRNRNTITIMASTDFWTLTTTTYTTDPLALALLTTRHDCTLPFNSTFSSLSFSFLSFPFHSSSLLSESVGSGHLDARHFSIPSVVSHCTVTPFEIGKLENCWINRIAS
ncbi:hypothetical protein FRC18_012012 [Serendipita sp. 400]|nr:hypothetical protein FRC18_012012 [Serendipita sp. 400]